MSHITNQKTPSSPGVSSDWDCCPCCGKKQIERKGTIKIATEETVVDGLVDEYDMAWSTIEYVGEWKHKCRSCGKTWTVE